MDYFWSFFPINYSSSHFVMCCSFAGSGISTWYTDSQWGMAHVSLPKETVFVAALDNLLMLHGMSTSAYVLLKPHYKMILILTKL